jgi:plastin-1
MGLIWQIIKIGLQANIDIKVHPELFRLLNPGEELEEFLRLPVEHILLRWVNYHVKKGGYGSLVKNFSGDVRNGEVYTLLLNQLASHLCSKQPLSIQDLYERAEAILVNADKLGASTVCNYKVVESIFLQRPW